MLKGAIAIFSAGLTMAGLGFGTRRAQAGVKREAAINKYQAARTVIVLGVFMMIAACFLALASVV